MMLPRPVCIEFGERDGITTPAWTAYAWKQVEAIRDHLGQTDRIELAHYDGVHEVHGVETFDFLDRFLRPERPVGRDGRPLVAHVLDNRPETRITGRFWIPAGAREFRGLALRVSRVGRPGPLQVRFGSRPDRDDIGRATLAPEKVSTNRDEWRVVRIEPQSVRSGQLVWFEIACGNGRAPADHYLVYGPKPLGGRHWGPRFGLSYRVRTDRPQDR
ncbi:MAG: hypothetical protein GXP27_02680, partial [Planctomycetes bacterium]|nr:hypothetical protein [Planctomycetota bacterium]